MNDDTRTKVLLAVGAAFVLLLLGPYFGIHLLGKPSLSPAASNGISTNSVRERPRVEQVSESNERPVLPTRVAVQEEAPKNLSEIEELLKADDGQD